MRNILFLIALVIVWQVFVFIVVPNRPSRTGTAIYTGSDTIVRSKIGDLEKGWRERIRADGNVPIMFLRWSK